MHPTIPQIIGWLLNQAKCRERVPQSHGGNNTLETKRDKQKCWLLFMIRETEFERLEKLCKYLGLSIETPEGPCHRKKDYIPVVKAKLK